MRELRRIAQNCAELRRIARRRTDDSHLLVVALHHVPLQRDVDQLDEAVEEARVDRLGEGVAPVVRLLELEILLDELVARLDLPLAQRLLQHPALQL